MGLAKLLAGVIKVEIFLANHYKVSARKTKNPILSRVLNLLGEESMLHATKLKFMCKEELDFPSNFAPLIDHLAAIEDRLGELVTQTHPSAVVLKGMNIERELASFYMDLRDLCAESDKVEISSFFQSLMADEEYHCSLLLSVRSFLGKNQSFDEEI